MKTIFTAIIVLLAFCCIPSFGQDIHFSQYNLTPLLINPAQAGAYKKFQAIVNYKNQWTSISPDSYKTMMLSCDGRLMQGKWKSKWLGTGVTVSNDKAGEGNMNTMQANLFLGYHLQLDDKNILGASLSGGFSQRSISQAQLTWEEQTDPQATSMSGDKFGYPDFGLGVLYQFNKGEVYSKDNDMLIIRAGVGVSHLNRPSYSFFSSGEKLYTKITGHADALIGIKNTNFALMPGFIFQSQGPAYEAFPGCYFRYNLSDPSKGKGTSIMLGTHFRVKDAFVPSLQFEIAEYTLGVNYDLNISDLKTATSGKGGIEIALRYGFNATSSKSAASFE